MNSGKYISSDNSTLGTRIIGQIAAIVWNISIVNAAAEEAIHAFQNRLVERVQSGAIKPGDPEFRQAQLFVLNKVRHLKIDARDLGRLREYANQPLERHAKEVAKEIAKLVQIGN